MVNIETNNPKKDRNILRFPIMNIPELDAQDQEALDILNALKSATKENITAAAIQEQLDLLKKHFVVHFKAENKHMIKNKYPGLEAHAQDHARFLKEKILYVQQENGNPKFDYEVLINRISGHINTHDRVLAKFLKNMSDKTPLSNL